MLSESTGHPDYEVGTRVLAALDPLQKLKGRLVGRKALVSGQHVLSVYVVLLDDPLVVPGWDNSWEEVTCSGCQLQALGLDGVPNP